MFGFGFGLHKIGYSGLPPIPPGQFYMITETGVQITDEAGNVLISENQLYNLWNDYSARVIADGGIYENNDCLITFLDRLLTGDGVSFWAIEIDFEVQ